MHVIYPGTYRFCQRQPQYRNNAVDNCLMKVRASTRLQHHKTTLALKSKHETHSVAVHDGDALSDEDVSQQGHGGKAGGQSDLGVEWLYRQVVHLPSKPGMKAWREEGGRWEGGGGRGEGEGKEEKGKG